MCAVCVPGLLLGVMDLVSKAMCSHAYAHFSIDISDISSCYAHHSTGNAIDAFAHVFVVCVVVYRWIYDVQIDIRRIWWLKTIISVYCPNGMTQFCIYENSNCRLAPPTHSIFKLFIIVIWQQLSGMKGPQTINIYRHEEMESTF